MHTSTPLLHPRLPRRGLSSKLATLLTLGLAVAWSASPALAGDDDGWSFSDDTSFELEYEGGYNSNILELSERDIDRFEANELTLATPVDTYDDFTHSLGFHFRVGADDWWGWRDASLSYGFRYLAHANNPYNDRPIHSLWLSTDIIERVDVFASWLYIPDRYLRDYYDRDVGETIGTYFEYSLGGAGVQYSPTFLRGWRFSARVEQFTIYYNPWFTEYDSEGWGIRFDARYRVHRNLTVTGILKRRWSDNVGFDDGRVFNAPDSDIPVDAEYGDGTYGEEWFELAIDWTLRDLIAGNNVYVDLEARLRHRFYDTDLPVTVDPIHAGREHMHWRFLAGATTRIAGPLRGGPFVEYEFRRTDSPLQRVIDTKDFDTFRAYVKLSYDLW